MSYFSLPGNGAPLTGLRVLLILCAFFGVISAVNAVMIYDAISTFRGEVVAHPFEVGLAYDHDIAAAEAQTQRGWKVDVSMSVGALSVTFRDAAGKQVQGLDVTGVFAAPADMSRDQSFTLSETGYGVYAGASPPQMGVWDLTLVARRDGETLFKSKNRVDLK
jgi:nitrogen fixation protein FixH